MNPTCLPSRRVTRLRLRAAAAEDASRASILLADAFHTASLPGADVGRLVLIRRLALGRISAQASPATLALHIERAAREITLQAAPFDSPAADGANAVILPGWTDAIVMLAQRHAQGADTRGWFWPEIVPGWHLDRSRSERWLLLLEVAHEVPEAAFVAAAVVSEAVTRGVEDELLGALPPGKGAYWLRAEGWTEPGTADPEPGAQPVTPGHADILYRWQKRWSPVADRLVWFGTMLAILEHPTRVADSQLAARIATWLARRRIVPRCTSIVSEPTSNPAENQPETAGPTRSENGDRSTCLAGTRVSPSGAGGQRLAFNVIDCEPRASEESNCERTEIQRSPSADLSLKRPILSKPSTSESEIFSGAFTACGGLLFLVNVLDRLSFADFLGAHAFLVETGLAVRLLRFIGQRVGVKRNDPLILCLPETDPSDDALPMPELPACAQKILASPKPRLPLDSLLAIWLTVVRRWCRRNVRFGLVTLVRRPGRVLASRTHLDVCFDLAEADLRVRRLALDADPGWVPWLGYVVRFHYL
jgi:hypothetical protein